MRLGVDFNILNQKGTPAFYSDVFANRPAAGFAGRVFISTDTGAIYEDTGSAWTLIADAGAGTTGTLQQVTTNGNSTTNGITITANGISTNSITNTGNTNGSVLFAGAAGLESQSNATFFWDNNNKRLGIGNASPGAPLDVHGSGTIAQFNGTGTNNTYLFFQNAGTSKWRIGNLYSAGANNFELHNAATATTILSFDGTTSNATFNAGIRTTGTADQQLWVYGTSPSLRLYNTATSPTINGFVGMSTSTNNFIVGSVSGDMCIGTSTTGNIYLGSGTTTVNPAIQITTGNLVKIGGTGGTSQLNVTDGAKSGTSVPFTMTSNDGATAMQLYFQRETNTRYNIQAIEQGVGYKPLTLNALGSVVLIGTTTNNGQKLQVNGGIYHINTLWSGTNIQASQHTGNDGIQFTAGVGGVYLDYGNTSWGSLSDERFKTDLVDIDNALNKITQLRTVTGRYKNEQENAKHIFLIAQDLLKVFPEVVDTSNDEMKTLGVRYTELIPVLISAIKELNNKLVKNNIN